MAYEDVLAALADPTRRSILDILRKGPRMVSEIAERLPVSRPAVSQHLAVLKQANLVTERREGTMRIYSASTGGIDDLRRYLDRYWEEALARYAEAARTQKSRDEKRRK